ncbi:MAG: hypothetical protein A4S09_04845 [Proteobacteria bacterium SG_bin7]|nr:MAG: hypothetical protein A4S09_04845 [Proteobacteria bacterium SG_bin7]
MKNQTLRTSGDSSTIEVESDNSAQAEKLFENKIGGNADFSEWLTTVQAAKYLEISPASLRNMTSSGQVPYYKFGRRNRYRVDDLRNLLLSQKRGFYGN